jgi:hypothetical protein
MNLLPEGNLKWLNVCEKLTKFVQNGLEKEHETEFETLNEMTNRSWKLNHNVKAHLFYIELISNQ